MTILVLGSTGKTGRRVVERLRESGEKVLAASRSGEVHFDWSDPDTWTAPLEQADAVYLVAPEDPAPVADFVARASRIRRFVVLSGRGIEQVSDRFGLAMTAAEVAVRESDAEWTILRASNFNQNFDEYVWHEELLAGRFALPIGAAGEAFVDVNDVAAVAAALLTRDGHAGQIYEISGPRTMTFPGAVADIAAASGREIAYVELTPDAYRAELLAAGWPQAAAEEVIVMFELLRTGRNAPPTDTVERVLGRPATDFADYVERVWRAR
ncbi:NAD(P)H-binding protein [Nocardia panacis]|nr:NAD(P)H-binding protein [Nocardia panacis]